MTRSGRKERRAYLRHPAQIPIVCRREGSIEPVGAELRDIGCGGMAFVSALPYEPGAVVSLDYPTLNIAGVRGEVVWSDTLGDGTRRYSCGIRFLERQAFARIRIVEQICRFEVYRRTQRDTRGRRISGEEAAREWTTRTARHFPK